MPDCPDLPTRPASVLRIVYPSSGTMAAPRPRRHGIGAATNRIAVTVSAGATLMRNCLRWPVSPGYRRVRARLAMLKTYHDG